MKKKILDELHEDYTVLHELMKDAPKKRESGYYWVKYDDKWLIGECWEGAHWLLSGCSDGFHDSDFTEIDERKIERKIER